MINDLQRPARPSHFRLLSCSKDKTAERIKTNSLVWQHAFCSFHKDTIDSQISLEEPSTTLLDKIPC